jgi:hypothetical protein
MNCLTYTSQYRRLNLRAYTHSKFSSSGSRKIGRPEKGPVCYLLIPSYSLPLSTGLAYLAASSLSGFASPLAGHLVTRFEGFVTRVKTTEITITPRRLNRLSSRLGKTKQFLAITSFFNHPAISKTTYRAFSSKPCFLLP